MAVTAGINLIGDVPVTGAYVRVVEISVSKDDSVYWLSYTVRAYKDAAARQAENWVGAALGPATVEWDLVGNPYTAAYTDLKTRVSNAVDC